MATVLVVHGAWAAGWFWRKLRQPMRDRGHELVVPTLTGVGDRHHLAHENICLETHIEDILQVLEFEDLHEVLLVGHSYGGMVASGVADRVPQRLRGLTYLDAFVPRPGECLFDLLPEEARSKMREDARVTGDGWRVPPNPMPPDTNDVDKTWAVPRRVAQPIKTFEQPLSLSGTLTRLPKAYIYCLRSAPGDVFRQFADRAEREDGWTYIELDSSHNPQVTVPSELAALLDRIAQSSAKKGV